MSETEKIDIQVQIKESALSLAKSYELNDLAKQLSEEILAAREKKILISDYTSDKGELKPPKTNGNGPRLKL
ncbi:MAG: hypothetical protein WC009_02085 [Methylotenera sp.]